jgi:hypothetical protein
MYVKTINFDKVLGIRKQIFKLSLVLRHTRILIYVISHLPEEHYLTAMNHRKIKSKVTISLLQAMEAHRVARG